MNYKKHLESPYWKEASTAAKRRDGYKCKICNSPHDLNVHHRTYENLGHEMDHLGDLVTLCRRCHAMFHGKTDTPPVVPVKAPVISVTVTHDLPVTLTMPLLLACASADQGPRGKAFTAATTRAFGVNYPLKKGWLRGLVGQTVSGAAYQAALDGRTQYAKRKRRF
jgi:hypothetical protein